tara:strand:+ start:1205 stop:1879 length:675 start_codon:yes stop_codon:yes gene_type:complete
MKQIGVTRFTDETYEENKRWKQSRKYNGSIYGFDREVSIDNFNYMGTIYTIDIRCSPNTKKSPPHIYGIGVIRFLTKLEWRTRIYSNQEYNRFIYKGDKYKTRDELIMENKENEETIEILEKLLCTGPRHFKRGDGLTKLTFERIMSYDPDAKSIPQRCSKCGALKKGHKICKRKHAKTKLIKLKRCKICQGPLKQNGGLAHICPGRKRNTELLKRVLLLLKSV